MINRLPHPYMHLLPSLPTKEGTDIKSDMAMGTVTGALETMRVAANAMGATVDMTESGAAGGIACSTTANFACCFSP